jgi:hypothetical protein
VIDNREQVERLLVKLRAALPLSASVGPELVALIRQKSPGIELSNEYQVTRVDHAGDEGGIMCALALDGDEVGQAYFVSMTHLRFPRSAPLAREIAAYQKHRVKRLRRQAAN